MTTDIKKESFEILFSSESTCSTLAPIDYNDSEIRDSIISEEPPVKRTKLWHGRTQHDTLQYSQKPRKETNKTCNVCGKQDKKTHSVRYDSIWLYRVIFPGHDLMSKDRLCCECQNKFKTAPCVNCSNVGGSYWLSENKIKEGQSLFGKQDLKPGRLCYICGDRLSKHMKKKL